MQANNTPRLLKNFMIGLVASSAGAFIALPGSAMPESTETSLETEATEEVASPTAAEALPAPGAEALETEPTADADPVEEEMVAEEAMTEEVASDEMTEAEAVATEDTFDSDADTVEAAEIEALSDEAIEAADTMDGEPVVEEVEADEEPVAEDTEMEEMPVAEDGMEATEEPVAEDMESTEEPVAEDAEMEEMPVADEEATDMEPVAAEELNTADFTIAELTDNSDSFEILAAALAAADLTEILSGEGPFTVFAPTDDAFEALPEGSVDQLLLPENKDILVQVLTYHVVPGAILSTDLEDGSVATVEGSDVEIAITDTVTVNNANVVAADIEASNGIIHVIDRVIIPPSPEADAEVEADETAAVVAE